MRRVVAFVLFVTLAAACGDDGGSDDRDARPREPSTTTTTEDATTTTTEAPTTTTTCPAAAGDDVRALVDLDGDGVDEVWRAVGSGASTEIVELRRLDAGCAEVAVLLDGAPAQFPIGGTVTHLDGLRCDGSTVEVSSATSDDGATYVTEQRFFDYADGALLPSDAAGAGTIDVDDPALADYSTFTC